MTLGGFGGAGPRTIFQIGSVTKVFTALLLADMAERGEVKPSDQAAAYLPGAPGPGTATLTDLATHTSGLPRLPRSLLWSARLSPRDPYARYSAGRFVRTACRSLRTASGGNPYAYSNYGFGVLGYLLGQAAGAPYETLVTERICGPLGLPDTTFGVPAASRDRVAQGHRGGRAVPEWHLGAFAAAGGLYSTAADMASFLRACLTAAAPPAPVRAQAQAPLAGAIRATLATCQAIPAGEIGLAWHHSRPGGRRVIWHNGMTGGFSSMIAFDPARNSASRRWRTQRAHCPRRWTRPCWRRSAHADDASLIPEHAVTELDDGVSYPRFDRAERGAQDGSDLAVGVPTVESERDGLSLQVGELVQAAEQSLALVGAFHGLLGLVPRDIRDGDPVVARSGGGGAPDPVDGAAPRHR